MSYMNGIQATTADGRYPSATPTVQPVTFQSQSTIYSPSTNIGTSVVYTGIQQQQQHQPVNGATAITTPASNSYLHHGKSDGSISVSPRQKTPISLSQYVYDPSKGQMATIPQQQQQFHTQMYYNTENANGMAADPSQIKQGNADHSMLQRQQSQLSFSNTNSPSVSSQIMSPVVQTPAQFTQTSSVPAASQPQPQAVNGMGVNSGMVNASMIPAQQIATMGRTMTPQQQAMAASYYKTQQQNATTALQQQQLLQQQYAQQSSMGMVTPQIVSQNAALQSQLLMQQQQQQQQQQMFQRNQLQQQQQQHQQQQQYQQQVPQANINKARLQQQLFQQPQQIEQQQIAQQQIPQMTLTQNGVASSADKYLRSLYEFMQARGTPIQVMPIVSGRQVHLISLHTAVTRFGGFVKLNQTPNGWQMVAASLGFNPQVEITSPQELAKVYMDTLYPFDEHLKLLQASQQTQQQAQSQQQHQFQQQTQQQLAVATASRQASPQVGITQAATPPQYRAMAAPEQVQTLQLQKQATTAAAAAAVNAARIQRSPSVTASPQRFHSPSPVLNNKNSSRSRHQTPDSMTKSPSVKSRRRSSTPLNNNNNNNIAVNNSVNRATPISRSDSYPEMMPPPSGTPKVRKSQPPQSVTPTVSQKQSTPTLAPVSSSKPLLRLSKDDKDKYLPKRRKLENGYKGGSNIYELNRLGTDIDSLVPDFPLFQELGGVEINALIMALKSLIPGEVRQALDKLALLSSNPNVPIVLSDCPDLITALGEIGLDLLNNLKANRVSNTVDIMTGDAPGDELKDDEEDGKDLVTKIFEAYRTWDESNEEVVVQVDDVTGEPVGEALESSIASEALEKAINKKPLDEDGMPISSAKISNLSFEEEYSTKTIIGFQHYDTLFELSKDEVENLNPQAGINKGKLDSFWQEALVDRFLCVCLIIRNLSFTEQNQPVIVNDEAALTFLLAVTRALALDGDKLFSKPLSAIRRRFSLQKDLITLYGNLGLHIKIPSLVDALVILLLILSFSPEESPYKKMTDGTGFELDFLEYEPTKHRYLGCAIDAIAKMITRDEPNKQYFKAIYNYKPNSDDNSSAGNNNGMGGSDEDSEPIVSDEEFQVLHSKLALTHPYELLTRTFALTIAALPRIDYKVIPKALELRRALLQQSLLVTELIIVDILDDTELAADWASASNGVITNTLLRTAFVLGAIYNPAAAAMAAHPHQYQHHRIEINPFERITVRCINILTLLGEKAMLLGTAAAKQNQLEQNRPPRSQKRQLAPRAEVGLPDIENVLSALLISTMNQTVVKKLCGFLEAGHNYVFTTGAAAAAAAKTVKTNGIADK